MLEVETVLLEAFEGLQLMRIVFKDGFFTNETLSNLFDALEEFLLAAGLQIFSFRVAVVDGLVFLREVVRQNFFLLVDEVETEGERLMVSIASFAHSDRVFDLFGGGLSVSGEYDRLLK